MLINQQTRSLNGINGVVFLIITQLQFAMYQVSMA